MIPEYFLNKQLNKDFLGKNEVPVDLTQGDGGRKKDAEVKRELSPEEEANEHEKWKIEQERRQKEQREIDAPKDLQRLRDQAARIREEKHRREVLLRELGTSEFAPGPSLRTDAVDAEGRPVHFSKQKSEAFYEQVSPLESEIQDINRQIVERLKEHDLGYNKNGTNQIRFYKLEEVRENLGNEFYRTESGKKYAMYGRQLSDIEDMARKEAQAKNKKLRWFVSQQFGKIVGRKHPNWEEKLKQIQKEFDQFCVEDENVAKFIEKRERLYVLRKKLLDDIKWENHVMRENRNK